MIYKRALDSFEHEMVESMEKTLLANQAEKIHGFDKIAKAVENLHLASSIFDDAGMHEESLEITKILKKMVDQLK